MICRNLTITIILSMGACLLADDSSRIPHKFDRFNGVVIDAVKDAGNFKEELKKSLLQWKKEGKRGVWLNLPIELAELVAVAAKEGFSYHHALKDKLVMTKWLPDNEPNMLPEYASRTAGISAVVLDPKNRILLVRER